MTSTQAAGPKLLHDHVRSFFAQAMARINVRTALTRELTIRHGALHMGPFSYELADYTRVLLVAIGKAAVPMASVTANVLRPALAPHQTLAGIAVSATPEASLPDEVQLLPGTHPVPGLNSRTAAQAIVEFLRAAGNTDLVLFLLSGGASSLVELPASEATTVEETAAIYRALLHAGLPIASMNTLRKHLSSIKGGQLAALAAPATQCSLIVSDVPGDALDIVSSGPSLPDPTTVADCHALLSSQQAREGFSPAMLHYLANAPLRETPKPGDAVFARSQAFCFLSNRHLVAHIAELASHAGYHVVLDNTCDDWDYREASRYLLDRVLRLRRHHPRVCLVSGGEVTVRVAEPAGLGGRNQHFALYTALQLRGTTPYVAVLSAGSDGADGNSPAAGALADNFTVARARDHGLDAAVALDRFDSYTLFRTLGDAIVTGPTGNNVRDIRILLSA